MEFIKLTRDGHIGTIVLDRPKKLNALSHDLVAEVIAALQELEGGGARVVVLRAQAGARVWSAGHDVGELPEGGRDPLGWDDPLRNLVRTIETCRMPVIAMIEGGVWGGAVETVLACDIIIAAPISTTRSEERRLWKKCKYRW